LYYFYPIGFVKQGKWILLKFHFSDQRGMSHLRGFSLAPPNPLHFSISVLHPPIEQVVTTPIRVNNEISLEFMSKVLEKGLTPKALNYVFWQYSNFRQLTTNVVFCFVFFFEIFIEHVHEE